MKAAVLHKPGDLRIEEVPYPEPGPGEITVKIEASGLCPTDVKVYRFGSSSARYPVILGHEVAGTVYEVGPGVEGIEEGEKVNIPADAYCGQCRYCRMGRENLCENPITFGFQVDGGHAEFLRVPKRFVERGLIFKVPEGVSLEEVAMTEPLACVLHDVESARTSPGKKVFVIGDGPMGLKHVILSSLYGADEVVLVGVTDWKLKLGEELGATRTVNINEQDPIDIAQKLGGADIVFLTVVSQATLNQAMRMVSKTGVVSIFAGLPSGSSTATLDLNLIHYGERSLIGSSNYTYWEYQKAFSLIASHRVRLEKLISHRFPLSEFHNALKTWEDKNISMKIMIKP
ncbi:MAG: alcohol dehydrogenase catalytic domain-containing protein [Infirmifilum sp.]